MTDQESSARRGPMRSAPQDLEAWKRQPSTPQTESPAYRLAFTDHDFILRDELRPVRLQLELLKPELVMQQYGIESTVVIFGSARIQGDDTGSANPALKPHYEEARKFARIVSEASRDSGFREYVVVSGGGPGIMEAANRGAADIGAPSIGLNIVLPHEQAPNGYITPELCLQFHYFALRKMHFLMRARAVVAFPGGFGTMDELFEALTLIQTGKVRRFPLVLFGEAFWRKVINFDALVEAGTISPQDIDLITFVETAEDGWDAIAGFYRR
ncbi:MAG: LOG family protein [Rhodobiaceae bacterium]|nr:LOG family protein [Rhodobiaceae bacterium]